LRAVVSGAGEIEGAEEARQVLALDESIDCAARRERFGGDVIRAPTAGEIEVAEAASSVSRIGLEVEPSAVMRQHSSLAGSILCLDCRHWSAGKPG